MKEIWKNIPVLKGYQASNLGRIKSVDRYVNHSKGGLKKVNEKILKQYIKKNGYASIGFTEKTYSIHRLIALTFLPNPHNKPCVNHLNGNKSDNRLKNLSWCTYSENEKYSYRVLGKKNSSYWTGKLGINHISSKPVIMCSKEGKLLNIFGGATEAERKLNFLQGNISTNCRGESKTCHGYIFKYISYNMFYRYKQLLHKGKKIKLKIKIKYNYKQGENHYNSKLTKLQIDKIKKSNEHFKILAKKYNVSLSTIYDIKDGRTWN